MKLSFNFFGKRYILSFHCITRPRVATTGLTSRVGDSNMHILLMDYDIIREDFLLNEIEYLQEAFHLGNCYLFQTRSEVEATSGIMDDIELEGVNIGGYHVICLDVNTMKFNLSILRSSHSDYAFINAPSYNPEKHWVLRIAKKGKREAPKFLTMIPSVYDGKNERFQSTFHARLLEDLFGLNIEDTLTNPDGNEYGIIDYYVTAKRVE